MLSSSENSFMHAEGDNFMQTEITFSCTKCKSQFIDCNTTAYYLPCDDLICESCLKHAKEIDSFLCIECSCCYTKTELEKIRSNKEIIKIIKSKNGQFLIDSPKTQTKCVKYNPICRSHNKSYLTNLYCFFHQKRICQDCLIEHQYTQCKLKIWSEEDSIMLLNEIKIRYARINDVESNLEENLMNLESKIFRDRNSMDIDVFSDFVSLYDKLNKIEENRKCFIYNFLEDENFLKSSLELSIYMTLCEKLKEKTILTNPQCLKFISNNFLIGRDFHSVFHIVNNCHNLIISATNRSNELPMFYVKYHDDFYILENLMNAGSTNLELNTKLKLIQTELRFKKGHNETETILLIDDKTFKYYDIFIFDNLLYVMNNTLTGTNRFKDSIQVLYFNDKIFYFDFLNFIEINSNNYLKISFATEEKISNLYLKLVRFTSTIGEFLIDYMVVDNPFSFHKMLNKCKIRKEFGGYFKHLCIERTLEIRENQLRLILDNIEINAKVESISYFRITI